MFTPLTNGQGRVFCEAEQQIANLAYYGVPINHAGKYI